LQFLFVPRLGESDPRRISTAYLIARDAGKRYTSRAGGRMLTHRFRHPGPDWRVDHLGGAGREHRCNTLIL